MREHWLDEPLTRRELDIVKQISNGLSNKEIGEEFSISERTVKHHLTNIFDKTGLSSRAQLVKAVVEAKGASKIQNAKREFVGKILDMIPEGRGLTSEEVHAFRESLTGVAAEILRVPVRETPAARAARLFREAEAEFGPKASVETGISTEAPQHPQSSLIPAAPVSVQSEIARL